MNPVAEKLREARKLIERGWTQRLPYVNGKYCALGAIGQVIGAEGPRYGDLRAKLADAIGVREVVPWNDAAERTQAEVLEAFDKAIALAESDQ